MAVFVSSKSAPTRHGAFAIERTPPATVRATGTGRVNLVAQFPWGPVGDLTEPATFGDLLNMFAPAGMDRTSGAYLALIGKRWPELVVTRVLDPTATAAQIQLVESGPTNIAMAIAKYKGAEGNGITATVSNASDGDANHFNLTVTKTGASGTTEDLFENLNYSGVGADSTPDFSASLLLSTINKLDDGRPDNGTYVLAGGTDGSVDAADYTGTAGSGDVGLAAAENDGQIRHICVDDPGSSLRAAVNAGLLAHATLMGDRVAYINGDSGLSVAATRTDVASYRSTRVVYADPWVYQYDDVDGTKRLAVPAPFLASIASQLSPSTSIAWKDPEVQAMLYGIVELESPRGQAAGGNTTEGIATIIKEKAGGYTVEAGVTTIAPSDPAKRNLTRTRVGDYIATSFVDSVRSKVDSPNVPLNQGILATALDGFMRGMKGAQNTDPDHTPHVLDYQIPDISSVNPQSELDAGKFTLPLNVKTSSSMEQIFLSIQFGETVTIQAA